MKPNNVPMAKESITKVFKDNAEVVIKKIDLEDADVKKRIEEVKEQQENLRRFKIVDVDRLKSTVFQL